MRKGYNPYLLPKWLRKIRMYLKSCIIPIIVYQGVRTILVPTTGDLIVLIVLCFIAYLLFQELTLLAHGKSPSLLAVHYLLLLHIEVLHLHTLLYSDDLQYVGMKNAVSFISSFIVNICTEQINNTIRLVRNMNWYVKMIHFLYNTSLQSKIPFHK